MRGARSILILAAVTLVAVGAVTFVERGSNTVEPVDELVFPKLLEQVNTVARVRVTGREGPFSLVRDGETWVVDEKERHPAEADRVHRLLLGAAAMKRVEPKTSNPELYPKLWLEDPSGADAKSVRYVLENEAGAGLADWVFGDRRPSKADASRTESYIRLTGNPMAWRVDGVVPGGATMIDWLDRAVARIDRKRLRAVEVVHADGTVIAVDKSLPSDSDFTLHDIPADREADSQYRINDIGRFLEDLRFEDVAPASSLDFAGTVDRRMRVVTFDGLRVHLDSVMRDGEAWVRLRAEVDEGLVNELVETPGADADAVADASADASDGEPKDATDGLLPLDAVRAEVERLNARWKDWAYELPSYKRDYLARRMDELTRALEGTDEGKATGDS